MTVEHDDDAIKFRDYDCVHELYILSLFVVVSLMLGLVVRFMRNFLYGVVNSYGRCR